MAQHSDRPDRNLIEEWRRYSATEPVVRKGFSDRLNFLIDCSDIGAPKLQDGRINWLTHLTGRTRATVNEWLNKDSPPNREMHVLVRFLITHLEGNHRPEQLEAWLIYGDQVVANPISITSFEGRKAKVKLAMQLIAGLAKTHDVHHSKYDFHDVLHQTVRLLENFRLEELEDIQPGHREIVLMHMMQQD